MPTSFLHARTTRRLATLLLLVAAPMTRLSGQAPASLGALRNAIGAGDIVGAHHGDYARYRPALARLYADSSARPLWHSGNGLTPQAEGLLGAVAAAESRGLRPSDYDMEALAQRIATGVSGEDALLRFDAALSLAAMRIMDHAHRGRVDPRSLGLALGTPHSVHDLVPLVRALSRSASVHTSIDAVEPSFARYRALEKTLARYRELAASPMAANVPASRVSVRPGQAWAGVPALRELLVALGDMPAAAAAIVTDTLSPALADGVKRFQRRHGLADDGIVGGATLRALRTPLSQRVMQIELAMERWRWLPDIASSRLVVVNIPAFRLYAFDRAIAGEQPVERMDVIVGRASSSRSTPVFTGTMREVVFHPYWDVPPSIARKEEIPHIRRDPGYAEREGMEIVNGGDVGAIIYPMTNVNLDRVAAGTLRLRQRPGPGNALGPVKFVFPNAFNVYLHGTPAQSLFAKVRRDFSHGCIRTSKPARLAEFVLKGQRGWDSTRIADAMRDGAPLLRVKLDKSFPVYILYTTVAVDDAGMPHFYPDLYGHDATLRRVLGLTNGPPLVADGVTKAAALDRCVQGDE